MHGYVCQRLFYVETADFLDDDIRAKVAAVFQEDPVVLTTDQDAATPVQADPTVSLYALARVRAENAMLLSVTVHGHRLVALLNSSSTMNFINADLMRSLHLVTTTHPSMRVLVANDDRVQCQGAATYVALAIDNEFSISCFGISLGEFDLILGVEFLRTLDPIRWDFEDLCISFTRRGHRVLWKGLGSPRDDIREPAVRAVSASPGQPLLDQLLHQFAPVFDESGGLPSIHPYDHSIHLLPSTAPVAVSPYRYPQLQ